LSSGDAVIPDTTGLGEYETNDDGVSQADWDTDDG
jgi:hypothetical protein